MRSSEIEQLIDNQQAGILKLPAPTNFIIGNYMRHDFIFEPPKYNPDELYQPYLVCSCGDRLKAYPFGGESSWKREKNLMIQLNHILDKSNLGSLTEC